MKILLTLALLVSTFVCLTTGQTSEHLVLDKFLARTSAPLIEYDATRRMEARNSKGKVIAWLELRTWLSSGNHLQYQILKQYTEDSVTGRKVYKSFLELIDVEREYVKIGSFKKSGFIVENYNFTKTEEVSDEFKVSLTAKRKAGLFLNGQIYLDKTGKLLRSEGTLTKNPSFWITKVDVAFTYGDKFGVTLPLHYNSEIKVRLVGEFTTSIEYNYTSVNGVPVPQPQ